MFNFDWFNKMQDLDKYFFLLSEGVLILLLIVMIPEVIENYKKVKTNKYATFRIYNNRLN